MDTLFVFAGGALGALFRYLILLFFKSYPINVFGVFLVNMLGCFILGFVSYIAIKRYHLLDDNMKNFLIIGFAGGFTTFSAFTHPVLEMLFMKHYIYVFLNLALSVVMGLFFVSWGMNLGYLVMTRLIKSRKLYYRRDY